MNGLKNQYLNDSEDWQLYGDVESVALKYQDSNHALAGFLIIPKLVQELPGGYYQVANEPDWAPYVTPEDYALYYIKGIEKNKAMLGCIALWLLFFSGQSDRVFSIVVFKKILNFKKQKLIHLKNYLNL